MIGCLILYRALKRRVRSQPPKLRVDKIDPVTGLPFHHPVSRQHQGLMPLGIMYPSHPTVAFPGAFGMQGNRPLPRTFDTHRFQEMEGDVEEGGRREEPTRQPRAQGLFHDLARDRSVV